MNLNEFAARHKRQIFDELVAGSLPTVGEFNAEHLAECRTKGKPQIGATRLEPTQMTFEYLFPDPSGGMADIFSVTLQSPERIVFLPVPTWVIETIWQGEIAGSHHFESGARRLVEEFRELLEPETNAVLFGPKAPTRRE